MTGSVRGAASAIAVGVVLAWVTPAMAQQAGSVAQELAEMGAQMERMARRIDELESQLAQIQASVAAATIAASEAQAAATEARKAPPVDVSWKGAPQFKAPGGWSFKPRGRLRSMRA